MRDLAVRTRHGGSDGASHVAWGFGDRRPRLPLEVEEPAEHCLSRCGSAFHIGTVDRALWAVVCTVLRSIASSAASLRARGEFSGACPWWAPTAGLWAVAPADMGLRGSAGPATLLPLRQPLGLPPLFLLPWLLLVLRQYEWRRAPCPQGAVPGSTRSRSTTPVSRLQYQ